MATVDSKQIDLLNELIEATIDSMKGYEHAADLIKSAALKAMFSRREAERRAIVAELQALVGDLGGDPETEESWLSRAHRAFTDLKSAVTKESDLAILQEVERGEDYLRNTWQEKLDTEMPLALCEALERHFASVVAGHDEVRSIRHAAEAAR